MDAVLKEYPILNKIGSPDDLKLMDINELGELSQEIRRFLVKTISRTGGHLASNLGVVELTIALHYCFSTPEDKIVWDVGHQSYVHKMLTGRKEQFDHLRKFDGMSGFPKSIESEHDAFNTGHSSTSISAALGMAVARDISGGLNKVIAVIGDGSMTGGLAYEGLNNAGSRNTDLIVILNDNEMSISRNVGAISRHLTEIRTSQGYLNTKERVKSILAKLPVIGGRLERLLDRTKNKLKDVLVKGGIFHDMGFNYIGPYDGHDIAQLLRVLNQVRDMKGPILLHVYTKKGKGYDKAEYSPASYHAISSFNVNTGKQHADKAKASYSDVFGNKLVSLAAKDKRIVAVTAAMPDGTGLGAFAKKYPDRFFDVGIAEGHGVTFSAGMAKEGLVPYFAVYSTFLQRGYDQVLHDVCMQNLHVVFAVDRAGIVGEDGETHQGIYDISYLMHIPNMHILCPKNQRELEDMLEYAAKLDGPAAVRYPRGKPTNAFDALENEMGYNPLVKGKSEVIFLGERADIAIVALGTMTEFAFKAHEMLKRIGVSAALINARFAKPIDKDLPARLKAFKFVFTIEDNCIIGGFGEKLMSEIFETAKDGEARPFVYNLGFPDKFIEHGSKSEILKLYRLDAEGIFNTVNSKIKEYYEQPKKTGFNYYGS